jgi:hypothetical protein
VSRLSVGGPYNGHLGRAETLVSLPILFLPGSATWRAQLLLIGSSLSMEGDP